MISESYRKLNAELHETNPYFGVRGNQYVPLIKYFAEKCKAFSFLDYGCGKGTLVEELRSIEPMASVMGYDPAIRKYDLPPLPADVVTCLDVLEHVEPEYLDSVLADIKRLTKKVTILAIATRPAKKTLPDGRNAHLIVKPANWWYSKLREFFGNLSYFTATDDCVVCAFEV